MGRDREVETLEQRLSDTEAGVQVIDIVGEAGVGKSRLLYEFQQRISASVIFSGSCSPQDQQTPFLPFIEVVRASFGVIAGEDQAAVARNLDEGLKVLGLASAENIDLLLNFLGLNASPSSLQGLDGALIGFRTRDLVRRLLQARCRLSAGFWQKRIEALADTTGSGGYDRSERAEPALMFVTNAEGVPNLTRRMNNAIAPLTAVVQSASGPLSSAGTLLSSTGSVPSAAGTVPV